MPTAVATIRRALVVGPTPPPYAGVEVMTQNVLACRDEIAGWHLSHCETQKPGGLAGKGALNTSNVLYSLRTWITLVRAVRAERPHLVHLPLAQNTLGFLRDAVLLLSARALGARVLLHAYGGDFHAFAGRQPAWRRRLIRWALSKADRVAIVGASLGRQFAGFVPEARLSVVPNCIALPEPAPARLARDEPLTVLFLGKISVSKGAVVFVQAAEQLLRPGNARLRFRMVGDVLDIERNITFIDNPHGVRQQIDQLLQNPWCRDAITIAGSLEGDTKWREYARADIFVAPSYAEAFPLTLLEAMSMGLPVVATNVGAIRETLTPRQQAFMVEPGDSAALADRIATLSADSALRAELGSENRRLVESAHDLTALARHLQATYDETVASRAYEKLGQRNAR